MSSDERKVPSQRTSEVTDQDQPLVRPKTDETADQGFAHETDRETPDFAGRKTAGDEAAGRDLADEEEFARDHTRIGRPYDDDTRIGRLPGDDEPVTDGSPRTSPTSSPRTSPTPFGETPAHAAPDDIVLFDQDPGEVQARWRDLQAWFVDDPGEAVQRADGLVSEVVNSLTNSLNSRTSALRDRWKAAGAGEPGGDTEQLRLTLRDYRNVLERLLAISGTSPGQPARPTPYSSLGMR